MAAQSLDVAGSISVWVGAVGCAVAVLVAVLVAVVAAVSVRPCRALLCPSPAVHGLK